MRTNRRRQQETKTVYASERNRRADEERMNDATREEY